MATYSKKIAEFVVLFLLSLVCLTLNAQETQFPYQDECLSISAIDLQIGSGYFRRSPGQTSRSATQQFV